MRALASSLLSLGLIALAPAPVRAQHPDSATVGRWFGHAELTVPWTTARVMDVRLDIQPDGSVSGMVGDAFLVEARIYPDSRIAHAIGLARDLAIEGRLAGSMLRAEGVYRERVYMTLDRTLDHMAGELQTIGRYDGPVSSRPVTARVTLERTGAIVAAQGGSARLTPARVDVRQLSP